MIKEIYEIEKSGAQKVVDESNRVWTIESIEYGTFGIHLNVKGAEYPQRGYAAPEAVWACNIPKRTIVETIRLFSRPELIVAGGVFMVLPYRMKLKTITKVLESFIRLSEGSLEPYFIKDMYLMSQSKGIIRGLSSFLSNMGVSNQVSESFAKIIGHIFEYDSAYRLKVIDLISLTTEEKLLKDPKKEIRRILKIMNERDRLNNTMAGKVRQLSGLVFLLLSVPKIKKAFKKAVVAAQVETMWMDNIDRYWMCMREDGYDYLGLSNEWRKQLLKDNSLSVAEGVKIR